MLIVWRRPFSITNSCTKVSLDLKIPFLAKHFWDATFLTHCPFGTYACLPLYNKFAQKNTLILHLRLIDRVNTKG
jgi:hypothetical protein